MIIFGIFLFLAGAIAGGFGGWQLLVVGNVTNALLSFLIAAVLISASLVFAAILDLEKTVRGPKLPPPLPKP